MTFVEVIDLSKGISTVLVHFAQCPGVDCSVVNLDVGNEHGAPFL